jgi:glycosyltransferase involved in cell wall biosynthesis
MPSVSFILDMPGNKPIGGYKIVYEYADRLSQRGWKVNVIHPAVLLPENGYRKIRAWIKYYAYLLSRSYSPSKWFPLKSHSIIKWVPSLLEKYIPTADYIVACPYRSASIVNTYEINKGKKFYFIQHFEAWAENHEAVLNSWKLPLRKIVISKWLQEIGNKIYEPCIYIPNGIDFSFFEQDIPFDQRPNYSICLLYHNLEWKGSEFAVKALRKIKDRFPEVIITFFSIHNRPKNIDPSFHFYKNPSQKKLKYLYNSSKIFISPSLTEGWGLTPCEAMLCGCAVIATNIDGHREFLIDGVNGLFCKPSDPDSIVEKVEYLFNNPDVAERLSKNARESLKKFDWNSRTTLFEQALLSE